MNALDTARAVGNAVLYEGYLLYPYTASAAKNRLRWQFGVVAPREYATNGTGENAHMQTEVLVDASGTPVVGIAVRFLHVQARTVEAAAHAAFEPVSAITIDGTDYLSFDESVEQELTASVGLTGGAPDVRIPIDIPAYHHTEKLRDGNGILRGRIVRRRWALRGTIAIDWERPGEFIRLRVRIENDSEVVPSAERGTALRTAFVSTHTLLTIEGGRFVSPLDPPHDANGLPYRCDNQHTWPVLVGEPAGDEQHGTAVLSSPIILDQFPKINARSDGDKFDGTEIDELLNLSILTLSDDEKREARATDPAARTLIDRAESLSPDDFLRMHGIMGAGDGPGAASITVGDVTLAKGSRVRLHPSRRADSWDMFLDGKDAHVQAVHTDFEGLDYVAVTVDDDPASDFHEWYGRSLFFYPDEVEPL